MDNFIELCVRTESPAQPFVENITDAHFPYNIERLVHAAIGVATEAGELLDPLKKAIFYGKELDVTNLREEAGDILWYLAILFNDLGTDFPTEMDRVIRKLAVRYPDRFSDLRAIERDLDAERRELEK